MMVTFISQCEKNALKKTRRVLDAFADRIGDNTWQTIITQDGLDAVKKLLRKTASKSTAVSCHWLRSGSRSELVWVVGNASKFDRQGRVAVNRTRRVLTGSEWETGWVMATSIQILATIAALLHDLGKATTGFQKKLTTRGPMQADPYRHEWISLRLFEAMIAGCTDDCQWLTRLADFADYTQQNQNWLSNLHNDSVSKSTGLAHLPPLARIIAWLIVTHHRLPFDETDFSRRKREHLCQKTKFLTPDLSRFYRRLAASDGWVHAKKACQERTDEGDFWHFSVLASQSKSWQSALKRWTGKALNHPPLLQLPQVSNPLLMHLSRLCLMVGDHNYSSLGIEDSRRVNGDPAMKQGLIANTCRASGAPKQSLDEHLLGVAQFTAAFSRLLPRLWDELPRLGQVGAFSRRTAVKRFQWQNRAWSLVKKHQKSAREQGFFGVNLASTGCGKTLGNARIMAALAGPDSGPRFTIALGLRVLTLQTGQALRERLNLDDTALATLVGGAAVRTLFELQEEDNNGSESAEPLLTEQVDYDHCGLDEDVLGTIIHDRKARDLLYAPVVSCTVDHMISATETARGGRHIVPMLRLLTSDLVLDEPDDFDQSDLPALTRLVHMAGMLGSNVLLSSATLTPDLVSGLFIAYQEGRKHWQCNQGEQYQGIYCAWFDEFHEHIEPCESETSFAERHRKFITKRVKEIETLPARRIGNILPTSLPAPAEGEKINNTALAELLIQASNRLHQQHHERCLETGKTISVGLIRMANINPMFALAKALYKSPLPDQVQIHLCCYHGRQLMILRSQLERKLDRILNRNDHKSLLDHPEIRQAVQASHKTHHVFVVLATAVAEVGRDHDYDWAIIEPSSMRSIIQLVGRVWRHRPEKKADQCNVLIMDNNIKALGSGNSLGVGDVVFSKPGFESKSHLLLSHACSELITERQLINITAIPRITKPQKPEPGRRLADLEHAVMADLLNNSARVNVVNAFWQPNTAMQACIHLQRVSPFRDSPVKDVEFVAMLDEDQPSQLRFRRAEKAWQEPEGQDSVNSDIRYDEFVPEQSAIAPWLVMGVADALDDLSRRLGDDDQKMLATRFATVRLDDGKSWCFHPWFGFWPG